MVKTNTVRATIEAALFCFFLGSPLTAQETPRGNARGSAGDVPVGNPASTATPVLKPSPPRAFTLRGRVTDTLGQPLAEARVVITESHRSIETDPEGHYRISELPSGTYTVNFTALGFAPQVRRVVIVDRDVELTVALKPTLIELPPIQVTATPNATSALESPQPVSVVAGRDLADAQAPTLGETLEGVAGVNNLSTGVGVGKPVIRGLSSNRVLILDNGQRLETQQWGDEHGPNIETATAERIEVIRGPASVLYGSDALGGVINVIQAPLPDAIGQSSFAQGQVSLTYNANNKQPDAAGLLEGARGGLGWRLEASGRTSENMRTPDYTLWNSGNRAAGGSGTVGLRGAWGAIAGSLGIRDERIELTDEDPAATPLQRIGEVRARLESQLPVGQSHIDVLVGWERNRRREFEDRASEEGDAVALGLLSNTWTGDVRLHHSLFGLGGVAGVSGLRTSFEKFGEETLIPNSVAQGAGVYLFEQADVGRWQLSGGLRTDYRHLEVEDDAELGLSAQTRSWTSLVGNLGVLYRVAEPVALVFNVGRGFRAPSTFELFANGVHEGTLAFERGNPDLKTEKSVNTDLALRIQSNALAFEAGAFINVIQDFIYTVPVPGAIDPGSGLQIFDVTQGDARLTGFEASARWHPTERLHVQGSADYVWGKNTTTGNPLPSIPPFRFQWSARYEARGSDTWHSPYLKLSGETNARQTRFDPDEEQFFAQAFEGEGYQSQGYSLVHAGAGVGIGGANPVQLDFSVRNLFDQAYSPPLSRIKAVARDPGMGRAVVMKVGMEF